MRCQAGLCGLPFFLALPAPALALQSWDAIPVSATRVRGEVWAILGTGANQTVAAGPQGFLVVDAGYAELGERLLAALGELGGGEAGRVAYVVDTHWHFDHVGANAVYARAGATVVAHRETAALMARDRVMSALDGLEVPAAPEDARPRLLFSSGLVIPWGRDTVEVAHVARAHTAGDAVVYFRGADVVHVGDLFFNGMYPFIDVDHGGTLQGMVEACEGILRRTGAATLYVPGHGAVADRSAFESYVGMLRTVHRRVSDLASRGLGREAIVAAKPTADLDAAWSRGGGFNDPDTWVGLVADGYLRTPGADGSPPDGRAAGTVAAVPEGDGRLILTDGRARERTPIRRASS